MPQVRAKVPNMKGNGTHVGMGWAVACGGVISRLWAVSYLDSRVNCLAISPTARAQGIAWVHSER